MFRHALMNFGDKFNQAEIDDIFGEFEVDDDGFLEGKAVIRNQLERFPGKANETYVTYNFSNPVWNQYDF